MKSRGKEIPRDERPPRRSTPKRPKPSTARPAPNGAKAADPGGIASGCWIDLFERPALGGKLRRLVGPHGFRDFKRHVKKMRSLIVGPGVMVVPPRGQSTGIQLKPGQIVPDLALLTNTGELGAVRVVAVDAEADSEQD